MYQICAMGLCQWRFGSRPAICFPDSNIFFFLAKNLELLGGCQRKSVHRDHPWDHDFQRGTLLDPRRYAARAQDMQEATRRRPTHRTQLTFLAALETMREMGIRWGQERGATDTLRRPESSKKKKWAKSELPALLKFHSS